jgi:hypothetical protein
MRVIVLMLTIAAVAVPGAPTAMGAPTASEPTNAVLDWNLSAQNAIVVGRPPGSAAVLEGIVQAAIYDATVATEGGYGRSWRRRR